MKPYALLLVAFIFLLMGCTGGGASKPRPGLPGDAEVISGKTYPGKTFYRSLSPTHALAVNIDTENTRALRLEIIAGQILELGLISMERIRMSADGSLLTIRGEYRVFEFKDLAPEMMAKTTLIPASIETVCLPVPLSPTSEIGTSGYLELRVEKQESTFSLVGLKSADLSLETIQNPLLPSSKQEDASLITYDFGSFTLKIDKDRPYFLDAAYRSASFSGAGAPAWATQNQIVCHLNTLSAPSSTPSTMAVWFNTPFSDTFDLAIDSTLWNLTGDVVASNGKLLLQHAGSTGTFGLDTAFSLIGDFDTRINYSDLSFQSGCTYSAIGLMVYGEDGIQLVERREQIGAGGRMQSQSSNVPDTSLSGIFRLRRLGSVIYSYQSDGVTTLSVDAFGTKPAYLRLFGRDDGYNCAASGAFDNFTLN